MSSIHYRTYRLVALLLTLINPLFLSTPVHAQAGPQIRITPAELQIPAGKVAQAAVEVDGVEALYGVDIELKFDPNVVEVVGAAAGTEQTPVKAAPGTFLDAGFVAINQVDNTAGKVRYVMTQVNPSKPKSGSGILIVLNLRGKTEGLTTPLTLTRGDMAHSDGKVFSGALTPGQVKVVSAAQALPAATPFPTQAGGLAMPNATAAGATIAPTLEPAATKQVVAQVATHAATAVPPSSAQEPTTTQVTDPANNQTGVLLAVGAMLIVILAIAAGVIRNQRKQSGIASG
jgi:hypothetical protein